MTYCNQCITSTTYVRATGTTCACTCVLLQPTYLRTSTTYLPAYFYNLRTCVLLQPTYFYNLRTCVLLQPTYLRTSTTYVPTYFYNLRTYFTSCLCAYVYLYTLNSVFIVVAILSSLPHPSSLNVIKCSCCVLHT